MIYVCVMISHDISIHHISISSPWNVLMHHRGDSGGVPAVVLGCPQVAHGFRQGLATNPDGSSSSSIRYGSPIVNINYEVT